MSSFDVALAGDLVNGRLEAVPEPEQIETTWSSVNMAEARRRRRAGDQLKPSILGYDDYTTGHLLYPGRTHSIYGASESGKSWVAFLAVKQALEDPEHRCLILDFEDQAETVDERLTDVLDIPEQIIDNPGRFRYVRPLEPLSDRGNRTTNAELQFLALLDWRPTLVVIDGMTESMADEGLEPLSASDVAAWAALLPRRLEAIGAAVVTIDHTAKANDGRPTQFGSQHKKAAISGASYWVEAVNRPGRAQGSEPVEGLLRIRLEKDRGGWLRGRHPGEFPTVADVRFTSWPDGRSTIQVVEGGSGSTTTADPLAREIIEALADAEAAADGHPWDGESIRQISQLVGRTPEDKAVTERLKELRRSGDLEMKQGPRKAKLHRLTEEGRKRYLE